MSNAENDWPGRGSFFDQLNVQSVSRLFQAHCIPKSMSAMDFEGITSQRTKASSTTSCDTGTPDEEEITHSYGVARGSKLVENNEVLYSELYTVAIIF